MKPVSDGQTLFGRDGELLVFDGIGAGNGRLICTIGSFHEASVAIIGDVTELLIGHAAADESPVGLKIGKGIVCWSGSK